METQNLKWVDIAKGLGILAVVAGHAFRGRGVEMLYLFHMPLFFFLSGYLYRSRPVQESYWRDKALSLLVPYFCFLLLLRLPNAINQTLHTGTFMSQTWLFPLFGGRMLTSDTGVFWYVTCLFLVQQLMDTLLTRLTTWKVAMAVAFMLGLSYVNALVFPGMLVPFDANVVAAACPFFFAGHLMRKYDIAITRYLPLYLPAAVVALLIQWWWPHNTYDMKYAKYGTPVLTLLSALSLIGVVLWLAEKLSRSLIAVPLAFCGTASMAVMYLHSPVLVYLVSHPLMGGASVRFAVALGIGLLAYQLLSTFVWSRMLLLGSKRAPTGG